ncbi:MAG: fasciclin domain-containing protein [Actinomycetes bacterium]
MRSKFLATSVALLMGFGLVASACSSDDSSEDAKATTTTMEEMAEETTEEAGSETIVAIAAGNPDFSTLVELVTAANLAETLSGEGPFTVFAPTNEAFAAVPAETVAALKADPSGALTDVLKLHVIGANVDAAAATAAAGTCVDTLGGKVKVEKDAEGNLTIGGAKVVKTDIKGSNGTIHVIDGVITAPSEGC